MEDFSMFMPHGSCMMWIPSLISMHVISDLLIALAYFVIPIFLFYIHKKAKLPYSRLFAVFSLFVFSCGVTHVMSIIVLWKPLYWTEAFIKIDTAIISLIAASKLIYRTQEIIHHLSDQKYVASLLKPFTESPNMKRLEEIRRETS